MGDPSELADGDVLIIQTGINGGYAFGNNAGIRALLGAGVDTMWILNNDTQVAPDALNQVHRVLDTYDGAFLAGTMILQADNRSAIECVGGARYNWFTSRSRLVGHGSASWLDVDPRLDYISGASMLINRRALDLVGLLDEDFFLYFEEVDLAARAKMRCVPLIVCHRARVWHRGGGTVRSSIGTGRRSVVSVRSVCRSAVIVTRKHRPWLVPFVVLARLGFAASMALRGSTTLASAALEGLYDGLLSSIRAASK
jgi:GT2 family glycosyltransferase